MPTDTTPEPRAIAAIGIGFAAMAVLDSLALIKGLEPIGRVFLLPAFGFFVYRLFRFPSEPFGKGFVPLLRKLYANPSTRPVAVLLDFPYSALLWFIGRIHATGRLATALGAGLLTYFLAALLLDQQKGTPYFAGAHIAGAVVAFGTWRAFQWGASNVLTTVAAFALRAALVYAALVSIVNFADIPNAAESDSLLRLYGPRNPPNGYILAACALVSAFFFWSRYATAPYYAPRPRRDNIRGRGMTTLEEAHQRLNQLFGPNRTGVIWGQCVLPDQASTAHFWVTGAPGSGKTLTLRALLTTALLSFGSRPNQRAIIFDPKRELLPFLVAVAPKAFICTLNPFDRRHTPWHIAWDIRDEADAVQFAEMLIPEPKAEPFWSDAPRHLLSGVTIALQRTVGADWTLRDLLLIMRDEKLIRHFCSLYPNLENRLAHLEIERTSASVFSQIQVHFQRYETVAALWDYAWQRSPNRFSVKEWLPQDNTVQVLSIEPAHEAALRPIYQLLFRLLANEIRGDDRADDARVIGALAPENDPRTWLILDEAFTIGKLPGLKELMAEGRSKGACVVLGFQDIHDMYTVYGENEMNGILGQCGNKGVLRIENGETAEIMAKQFAKVEVIETTPQFGPDGTSQSQSYGEAANVLPKELMDLGRPGPGPLEGFFKNAYTDAYRLSAPSQPFIGLATTRGNVASFEPMPAEAQTLRAWDESDLERLRIPPALLGVSAARAESSRRSLPASSPESPKRRRSIFSDID